MSTGDPIQSCFKKLTAWPIGSTLEGRLSIGTTQCWSTRRVSFILQRCLVPITSFCKFAICHLKILTHRKLPSRCGWIQFLIYHLQFCARRDSPIYLGDAQPLTYLPATETADSRGATPSSFICISYQLRRHNSDHRRCHLSYSLNVITEGICIIWVTCLVAENTENFHLWLLESTSRRNCSTTR